MLFLPTLPDLIHEMENAMKRFLNQSAPIQLISGTGWRAD